MSLEVTNNIKSALFLFQQAKNAHLNFGCFETSLQALGGHDIHFYDILYRDLHRTIDPENSLGKSGLNTRWMVNLHKEVTPDAIRDLLEGNVFELEVRLPTEIVGPLAGFLCLETHVLFGDHPNNHVLAILPRHNMPKDIRRELKRRDAFLAIDTRYANGVMFLTMEQLANRAREAIERKFNFHIVQVRKNTRLSGAS